MAEKRKQIDWEKVERDYRAGILSVREIALSQSTSHVTILKHAKKFGWDRDLNAKIQLKADALVTKGLVTNGTTIPGTVTEREAIEVSARAIANIRIEHRGDIRRSKGLVMTLLDELDEQTVGREAFADLGEMMRRENDFGADRLNDIYRKVIATPGRIDSVKKLAEALRILITLEREAWGIKDTAGPDGGSTGDMSSDELLAIIKGGAA